MSSDVRVLVAIANHGTGNRRYLDQLIHAYATASMTVDVVVLSDIPKDLGPDVEVRVGVPSPNPWSLPFAHRDLFAERRNDYDVFIYSEDDTLVREVNIRAFLDAADQLHDDEVPGFLRSEEGPDGTCYISSIHTHFRWDPASVRQRGSEVFACFTNEHAACYMLTRQQLHRAIESGGFLVPPHEGRHDMLCAAATDPYTNCGMTKLVCLTRFDDFVLPHLPNKYIGRMGIRRERAQQQVDALLNGAANGDWLGPLFNVETRLPRARWSKNCYEQPDAALLGLVPADRRRVLVLGCGWGETERALAGRGHDVTVVPVDPVFAHMAAGPGITVVSGDLERAAAHLAAERFDLIVLPDMLHLVREPVAVLRRFAPLLAPGGEVVLSVPNHAEWMCRRRRRRGERGYRELESFDQAEMHATDRRRVRDWLAQAGLAMKEAQPRFNERRQRYSRYSLGMFDGWLALAWVVRAQRQ